jgi:mannose-1-phosphate guanylyltransferase
MTNADRLWGLVLAGGDGTRLQDLTRRIAGAPIPKQYCRIAGSRSLLEETLARVDGLVPRARTVAIVNRAHVALARPQVRSLPDRNVIVQPGNRDTGPGLVLSLLTLARRDPAAIVAVFPSDHHVRDAAAFRAAVRRATTLVDAHPQKIVLLGIVPDRPDPGMGYVVPGAPIAADAGAARRVLAFHEKPVDAADLVRQGALWSSFVMVFAVDHMLELLRAIRPLDVARLERSSASPRRLALAYESVPRWSFSRDVLTRITPHLLVVPAAGLGWSDWGTREAIERTLLALGQTPPWQPAPALHATA